MRKRIQLTAATVLTAVIMIVAGCDLFTLDQQSTTSLSPNVALETYAGFETVMVSINYRMQRRSRYGDRMLVAPDVLADHGVLHPDPSGRYQGEDVNAHGTSVDAHGMYGDTYKLINEANVIIHNIDDLEDGTEASRQRLKGEAYFQRALAYFDMARIWGYEPGREIDGWDRSVIVRTEPTSDVSEADYRERASNTEVYNQVVSDLQESIGLLDGNDRGTSHANHAAAQALLARVYLYLEDWDNAIDMAEQARASSGDLLLTDADDIAEAWDEEPHPEAIYGLLYDEADESIGSNAPNGVLTPAQWFDVLPSPELLSLFDEADARNAWFAESSDGRTYVNKYSGSSGIYTDYHSIIRYPELLLILAEAHAENGNMPVAHDALNELREARGLDPVSGYTNAEAFIVDEVFTERSRELHFEGHRWFDLKRRNMDVPKPDGVRDTLPHDSYQILANFSSTQVNNNPALEQNPGY